MIARTEFLQSIRESGYRSLEWGLAELIDNSIEAGATEISVQLPSFNSEAMDAEIVVTDNGCGMAGGAIRRAMMFGGSSRFQSRTGLGRFGMGLPCSSLAHARRFEVISRTASDAPVGFAFDLDEEISGVRQPRVLRNAVLADGVQTKVVWRNLDKVQIRAWGPKAHRIRLFIGRKYRIFLNESCQILVNGRACLPDDPLKVQLGGFARQWPDETPLEIQVGSHCIAPVEVRFSLLDVRKLAGLSVEEKRRLCITGKAGVSIVRGGREIDYGWFFIDRRRENYDDWWRAEIRFDPALDELFGVSFTKQGVRPTEDLRAILEPHLTQASRLLQRIVRQAHLDLARHGSKATRRATHFAETGEHFLPLVRGVMLREHRIEFGDLGTSDFLKSEIGDSHLLTTVNTNHLFYTKFYKPLLTGELTPEAVLVRANLVLLAISRVLASEKDVQSEMREHTVSSLSNNLKQFLRLVK